MGWQRTASVALVSATAAAIGVSAFWLSPLGRSVALGLSPRPAPATGAVLDPPDAPPVTRVVRVAGAPLAIPVVGVRPSDLTDTFAQGREEGARRHDAIDIPAPAGTPVLAAAPGTLEKLFTSEAGGLTIYVRSPDRRIVTYYAHLRDYAPGLTEGQPVRVGERLGSVGSTGNADPSAPHLHFAVSRLAPDDPWSGGEAINPYPLLTRRPGAH